MYKTYIFPSIKTLLFDIRLIAFQIGELKKINSIVIKQHANENIERFENETKFSKQGDNQHCSDKCIHLYNHPHIVRWMNFCCRNNDRCFDTKINYR